MPGGRPKGAVNKPKRVLLSRLQAKYPDWDPVIAMADRANDETQDDRIRFDAEKEVASYLYPKMKSVEHTGEGGEPFQIVIKKYGDKDESAPSDA